jgi:hypothetical protein
MTVRKVAFPIYLLAFSIVVTIAVAGFVLYTDRQNDRFELRDEIFLRILVDVAQRRRASGDLEGAEEMEFNILALQLAQGDCVQEIPKVLPPLSVP